MDTKHARRAWGKCLGLDASVEVDRFIKSFIFVEFLLLLDIYTINMSIKIPDQTMNVSV